LFNLKDLDRDHIAWELVPFYIAQLCMIGALTISPEKIVIGGYIMNEELLPAIKRKFSAMNGDYFFPTYMRREDLIQQSQLSKDANVLGALELARMAAYPEKGHKLSLVRTKQNAR
jgi:fructokinase